MTGAHEDGARRAHGAEEAGAGQSGADAVGTGASGAGASGAGTPGAGGPGASALAPGDLGAELGTKATLVQFSSAFCQPCRATRRVLADVAAMVPGVTHVEIDAEGALDLVRALRVDRTPTVLVLDAGGRVVRRASGQPRRADVIAALGAAM